MAIRDFAGPHGFNTLNLTGKDKAAGTAYGMAN
jgi:hypothetical protein